jgi:hypothetical protein
MKRPLRAIIYGFAIWWLWFGFVGISQLLPDSILTLPSYAMARLLVLVLLVVGFAIDYLRRVERSTAGEGLAVGLTWMALMIANDIGHFLAMEPVDLGLYLVAAAPLYAFIPLITTATFGSLMRSRTTTT